ncbi:MAG: GlsB/YeaQ/YmgE family stress response membrane protein [Roseiarcus sp.]|jgi:uncharacterized membrane protein YeaQ/YmgE (transglycosylase-associated protein family)
MDQPLGVMGTPGIGFFSLIIIGGLAGWIGGMVVGARHGILTNILVGIVGSWVGSELADMLHITVLHSMGHFVAALVGSIIVLLLWQAIQGRNLPQR